MSESLRALPSTSHSPSPPANAAPTGPGFQSALSQRLANLLFTSMKEGDLLGVANAAAMLDRHRADPAARAALLRDAAIAWLGEDAPQVHAPKPSGPPSEAQAFGAAMAYKHDLLLRTPAEQEALVAKALRWHHAWRLELSRIEPGELTRAQREEAYRQQLADDIGGVLHHLRNVAINHGLTLSEAMSMASGVER